jgi:hypothetical protein
MPWIVPRTDGCGEQLLIRIVVAGDANVRPITWTKRSAVSADHIVTPVFWLGGGVVDGMRDKKGTKRYTKGKQYKNIRQQRIVPRRVLTSG